MPSRSLPLLSSLAAVSSLASVALAQLGPDAFAPRATLDRFLPEQLPALAYPAYFGELEKAQALLQGGRYKAALYATFALPKATPAVEVALIRGEAYAAIGQPDAGRAALKDVVDADPRVPVLLARIDLADGRYDDAIARLKPVVASTPDAVAARVYLADAYERTGDFKSAVALDRSFAEGDGNALAKFKSDGALGFEHADELTLAAHAVDRWATVTGAYAKQADLHDTVLAMFVAAYDTVDRDYWPAHVAAASYLFDHGNKKDAGDELEAANGMNPNAVEVNALLGRFASAARDENGVATAIAGLRDVDPNSFDADVLDVGLQLQRRAFDAARAIAERCVDRQPKNLNALGLLASVHAASGDTTAMDATLARVDALDANDATARFRVAQTMSTVFYDSAGAAAMLRVAVERAPWWTEPQHALGVALIQEGDEDEARAVLDKAQAVDSYNVITVNYLRVLDALQKFKVFEGTRFTFKYDERDDPIVPLYLAPQMDAMYDDLVKQFGFAPPKKPIVEVFPDAPSFSARTSGMPGLETYGASLGRVMTVVAPRAGETLGPFNWARVMKHEFTHTLNLMETHGRVPRWLTEGLAVWEEHVPYRFAYVPPQLYALAVAGKMPTPAQMSPVHSEMDYMGAFWIARYIDETYGWPAILKLLDAYRDGKEDDDAFRAATGMDVATFHAKFSDWAKHEVSTWGYDEVTKKNVDQMTKQAETLTQANQDAKAIQAWSAIAKSQPMNPLPARRLAGLYLRANKPADALPFLLQTLPLELQDSRFAKRVARIYDQAGDPTNAMKYANVALGIDPYDPDAHDLLATFFDKAGDKAKVAQEKQVASLLRERRWRATPCSRRDRRPRDCAPTAPRSGHDARQLLIHNSVASSLSVGLPPCL